MKKSVILYVFLLICIISIFSSISQTNVPGNVTLPPNQEVNLQLGNIPTYSNSPYVEINNNKPYFTESDLVNKSYESYSDLDKLNRCGAAVACIGKDIMPTEERGAIGSVKPSGWQIAKYDIVDGKYLYNRCHLIGYQLTAENANEKNLITGTRYMNVQGMLPFETNVAEYIKKSNNHVMYRVTPIFDDNNLLASGVLMEAKSVEDNGAGIEFCVYCYNVQPGIEIDYATGKSNMLQIESNDKSEYVLNTNGKKIHKPSCNSVDQIKEENRENYTGDINYLLLQNYTLCKSCNP